MSVVSVSDPAAAQAFLESIELPPAPKRTRAVADDVPSYRANAPQALAIGSQIAEFAASVPAALRPHIANSFLLAQFAANSFIKSVGGGTKEWYDRYSYVLANSGWVVESEAAAVRDVSGSRLEVHQEIIPVLAAVLGPAVAAAAIVTAALNGLANMAKDTPWITLFNRESQRARANQFQISHVDAPNGGSPQISLACFELDAQHSVTQVLFFKFSDARATLRHFTSKLTINEPIFVRMQSLVEQRIADQVGAFIAGIDLR